MVRKFLEKKEMVVIDNLSLDYGFNQAKKSMKPLNDIISSVVDEEYNEDFINEMKNIEQEKSIHLNNLEDIIMSEEYEKHTNIKNKIVEIFIHTENELGMGGKLKFVQCTNDFFLVESEHRMDSNMMHTIMKHTNSTILLGNSENNVLVFRMK